MSPAIQRTSVVLPAPFSPASAMSSPGRTVRLMPSRAWTAPNRADRPDTDSSGVTAGWANSEAATIHSLCGLSGRAANYGAMFGLGRAILPQFNHRPCAESRADEGIDGGAMNDIRPAGPAREEPGGALFPGDGEMARRMREHPWAESPLGDPRGWPASLRTACRILLTSRFPMIVWWGEDLRFFYNDAYLPLLGSKHPALEKPGAAEWSEIWDIIGPMLASVVTSGQATWSEDLLLPMNRHGYWEETYWTYSYSPLHDDAGVVRGVFTAVSDTTERVVGERRLAALQDLGSLAGRARSAAEACQLVSQALSGAADVPFAPIYLRQPGPGGGTLATTSPPGAAPEPRAGGPGDWPAAAVLRTGRAVTVSDVADRFAGVPSGGWETSPTQAMVLPLPGEAGGPAGGGV